MATKKKKRSSKHRGNAAGIVETRGRTGRKLTVEERKKMGGTLTQKEKRQDAMFREPSWKGATFRAVFAALIFGLLLYFLLDQGAGQAFTLASFVLVFYIPLGYYTDQFLYKRRVRKEKELMRR